MTTKALIKDVLLTITGVTAFTVVALSPILAYAVEVIPQNQTVAVQTTEVNVELSGSFEGW